MADGEPATPRGALVTGGGTGIGRAIATLLAETGWQVAVCGRRAEPLESLARALPAGRCLAIPVDISDQAEVERLMATVTSRFGGLDLLVNNAAVANAGGLSEVTVALIEEMVAVNLLGTILVTRQAIPHLAKRAGSIVNIGSVGGRSASMFSSVYGATKAAVHHLTNCLASELAPQGIRVNTVAPGPVDTAIGDTAILQRLGRGTLRGRPGRPDEVAWWVSQLAGTQADWVTGAFIAVDGGAGVLRDYLGPAEAPAQGDQPPPGSGALSITVAEA